MWTQYINDEIKRLDTLTGANGASLPWTYSNAKCTFGAFFYPRDGAPSDAYFRFSRPFFYDPDIPDSVKIDVVRHEYAHYLDMLLNGSTSHRSSWKKCCHIVGAIPHRTVDLEQVKQDYREQRAHMDRYKFFRKGSMVLYHSFGIGTIVEIIGSDTQSVATTVFSDATRYLSVKWLADHSHRILPDSNCIVFAVTP